jgi:GMP synthase-like glutamine amidotransferase
VRRNAHREIGWFPVKLTAECRQLPLFAGLPPRLPAFHWHGDTFKLPRGAVRVGGTKACRNQGFIVGTRTVGLQFHIECAGRNLAALVRNGGSEMTDGPFVQSAAEILADPARAAETRRHLFRFLDAWATPAP